MASYLSKWSTGTIAVMHFVRITKTLRKYLVSGNILPPLLHIILYTQRNILLFVVVYTLVVFCCLDYVWQLFFAAIANMGQL